MSDRDDKHHEAEDFLNSYQLKSLGENVYYVGLPSPEHLHMVLNSLLHLFLNLFQINSSFHHRQDLEYTKVSFDVLVSQSKIKKIDFSQLDALTDDYDEETIIDLLEYIEDTMIDIPVREISADYTWEEIEDDMEICPFPCAVLNEVILCDENIITINTTCNGRANENSPSEEDMDIKNLQSEGVISYNMRDGFLIHSEMTIKMDLDLKIELEGFVIILEGLSNNKILVKRR